MTAPAGAVVRLYVDTRTPLAVGGGIHTGTGRRYEILEHRVQQRGAHAGHRQHLVCRVMHPDEPDLESSLQIWWYVRDGKRRR